MSVPVTGLAAHCTGGSDTPVIVASTKQLFFDDYVIDRLEGLTRTVHPCTKHDNGRPVVIPDRPWEGGQTYLFGTALYNPDKKLYEMWYRTGPHVALSNELGFDYPELYDYAYAYSEDGLAWIKPLLANKPRLYAKQDVQTIDDERSKAYYGRMPASNVVLAHQELQGVVYTPDDPDPARQYKSCIFGGTMITSADGIRWQLGNTFYPGQHNTFNYDPARRLYFGYFIYPPYGIQVYDGTTRRVLGFSCSHDTLRWTGASPDDIKVALPLASPEIDAGYRGGSVRGKPVSTIEVVIKPDEADDRLCRERAPQYRDLVLEDDPDVYESHFYGMGVFPYAGVYIGFPIKQDVYAHIPDLGDDGPAYVELAFSRDLRTWLRQDRTVVIPNGPPGSWDGGMISVSNKPIIRNDEVWLYYGGISVTHGSQDWYMPAAVEKNMKLWHEGKRDVPSGIGIAKWRLDGFVSLDAEAPGGTLTTKPMVFSGNQLEINADASGGAVSVEIQDNNGRPVDGYSLADCDPVSRNAVHHIVSWKGRADVTLLSGHDLRLLFKLRNAKLYAFQFIGDDPRAAAAAQVEETDIDLTRVIQVGAEIVVTGNGGRTTMHAPNETCARCRGIIGEFEPARVFAPPAGAAGRLHFHVNCVGNVDTAGP